MVEICRNGDEKQIRQSCEECVGQDGYDSSQGGCVLVSVYCAVCVCMYVYAVCNHRYLGLWVRKCAYMCVHVCGTGLLLCSPGLMPSAEHELLFIFCFLASI